MDEKEKMRGRAHRNTTIRVFVFGGVIAFVIITVVLFVISKFNP